MNFFGTYHTDIRPQAMGVCDAPQISKGRMIFSAFDAFTEADGMAMCFGHIRNRTSLARELNCEAWDSQAKILLRAYLVWGEHFMEHVEGGCVCAVADTNLDLMIVARDKMGEGQLFYSCKQGGMAFADHPEMLLKCGLAEPVMGREEVCELFALGPARSPGMTFLRDIKTLPAGHMLICSEEGFTVKRYYQLAIHEHVENEDQTVEHTRALMEACIEDVVPFHPACMLSGGIDSTALTALMSGHIGRLESFSVDYRGNDLDFVANAFRPEKDAPYIQLAVNVLKTRHHRIVLEQEGLADTLENAMRVRGFPGMADIDSSLYLFAGKISHHAPSVVSGECGDEVFGGYPWFREDVKLDENMFPWSGSMQLRESVLKSELREELKLKDYVRDRMKLSLDGYDLSGADKDEMDLYRIQRLCFDYFMANLQERAAQMCLCHGLNVFTPLCDTRLVEYVYSVPWKMKRMGSIEKGLLRRTVGDLLPVELLERKKSPYPKTCSPEYTRIIRARMLLLCADEKAPLWKIADKDQIQRIAVSDLNPADTPWFGQLMSGVQLLAYLLQIDQWMRVYDVQLDLE